MITGVHANVVKKLEPRVGLDFPQTKLPEAPDEL
jgi:hypothetical protein